MSATDQSESGVLPDRLEWVAEPSYFGVPTDPSWQYFGNEIDDWSAAHGMAYSADNTTGSPYAQDQNRGPEDPSTEVVYDLERGLVDASGNAQDPAAYGMQRDSQNRLPGSLLIVARRALPGGNDSAGIREYTVVRGAKVEEVSNELDPSGSSEIPMTLGFAPRKSRSYLIHQPSSGTTLTVSSSSDNDTMDLDVESEGASTTETITLTGTTEATGAESFSDIDAAWLSAVPEGDITVTDGSGTTLLTIYGGNTYSDDDQPVDGDRGVPLLGSGSHASSISTTKEFFVGDRLERPSGTGIRPIVTSGGWSITNEFGTANPHDSRHPLEAEGNATVEIETTVSGPHVSHDNFVDALTKSQQNIEHELSNTLVTFHSTVLADMDERNAASDQARATYSVTWRASGEPAITLSTP